MLRTVVAGLCVALLALVGAGCGGSDTEEPQQIVGIDKSLEDAYVKEQQGLPLTGKEKRILEDAREEGVID